MSGRDHSIECPKCGLSYGGLNGPDECDCVRRVGGELAELTAERDALKAEAAAHKCHPPLEFHDRLRDLENENCQLESERDQARARVAELEQECRDRQGTEDSLVAWNEEQATRIATLEAALRFIRPVVDAIPGSGKYVVAIDAALAPPEATEGDGK